MTPRSTAAMKPRRLILSLAVLAVAAFLGYTVLFTSNAAPGVTFTSLKGEQVSTADLRGRVVLVNFWATDCPTCVKEMPRMVTTYNKFRQQGFDFIAVAMRHDPPNYVIDYTEKNALPFRVALDPMGKLATAFGDVKLTPTTIVIDKRGNIVTRILGEPDFAKLEALIEQKLAEKV
jgi:peroxiredoxin